MAAGGYKGTRFYRIIPGFMNQGGHTRHGCIYGGRFNDENFDLVFDEAYLLGTWSTSFLTRLTYW
eukprot:6786026-Pyramimonas_sp.AAC.1